MVILKLRLRRGRICAGGVLVPAPTINSDTSSDFFTGTSFAAPHAAGFAAIYLGVFPTASPATVSSALTGSATFNVVNNPGSGSPNRLLFTFFPAANPIDNSSQFVRHHYLDFLLREPDQAAGITGRDKSHSAPTRLTVWSGRQKTSASTASE